MADKDTTCLVPGCGRTFRTANRSGQPHARGMCGRCYSEARRMVRLKQTTWRVLEDLGFALLPTRKLKDKERTPLAVAMEAAGSPVGPHGSAADDRPTKVVRLIDSLDLCEGYGLGDAELPKLWAALTVAREVMNEQRRKEEGDG